jgi:hypothetical protein
MLPRSERPKRWRSPRSPRRRMQLSLLTGMYCRVISLSTSTPRVWSIMTSLRVFTIRARCCFRRPGRPLKTLPTGRRTCSPMWPNSGTAAPATCVTTACSTQGGSAVFSGCEMSDGMSRWHRKTQGGQVKSIRVAAGWRSTGMGDTQ